LYPSADLPAFAPNRVTPLFKKQKVLIMIEQLFSICVVGGTGAEGSGLALRWARAGHRVAIGSRDESKAKEAAKALNVILGSDLISGINSKEGAGAADIVVLTVPFSAQMSTVDLLAEELVGKILIDVTVPLVPPKVSQVQLPDSDSCVVAVQRRLGDRVRVVSAFQNVSAHKLKNVDAKIDCDVLVASNDKEARGVGVALADAAGLRGIDVGPLANSVVAESLTSVLISINRKYKVPDAGIRITGLGIVGGISVAQ
jgi:8-hydroxy-5-deazaflavin:NADPH oxidoreductase